MVESSDAWLSEQELAFLRELDRRGVRYLSPPMLGGGLGDRFDVVLTMSGLPDFDAEHARSSTEIVSGVPVRVLSLDRVAASKRAANRPKDALALKQIDETLAVIARMKGAP